jgi:hypothetical protein
MVPSRGSAAERFDPPQAPEPVVHQPHRDDFGGHADRRIHSQRQEKTEDGGRPIRRMNSELSTPPSMPVCPTVQLVTLEAEYILL